MTLGGPLSGRKFTTHTSPAHASAGHASTTRAWPPQCLRRTDRCNKRFRRKHLRRRHCGGNRPQGTRPRRTLQLRKHLRRRHPSRKRRPHTPPRRKCLHYRCSFRNQGACNLQRYRLGSTWGRFTALPAASSCATCIVCAAYHNRKTFRSSSRGDDKRIFSSLPRLEDIVSCHGYPLPRTGVVASLDKFLKGLSRYLHHCSLRNLWRRPAQLALSIVR